MVGLGVHYQEFVFNVAGTSQGIFPPTPVTFLDVFPRNLGAFFEEKRFLSFRACIVFPPGLGGFNHKSENYADLSS